MIKEFYQNKEMRQAVEAYLINFIEMKAVELIFDRKDTSHIADAKDLIDGAFEQMQVDFAPKPVKKDLNNAI